MTETAIERMCRETGIDRATIAGLGDLDVDDIDRLREAFLAAQRKRDADLTAATEDGLRVVPRLLRPAIKKILFG
ncbi:hypothetical protein OG921_22315 [Aldersonia sp. NBC_00410]|uniref:hypothetical protein n=1 Tax=Aldersonia sp. NBC_00410 TaxID=2975954 RepID=UPI00225482D0|nr:hypothetical protein [Aldersonia sp. NBC_00410]MCX5045907.1 hypothetical protein [Aldersonia sp. NBC_00410]